MRTLARMLLLLLYVLPASAYAQPAPGLQSVFLGDITCGDNSTDCVYPGFTGIHRYLHIVLHDLAGNDDWQVQSGPVCAQGEAVLASGIPITDNGFLEVVVDLDVAPDGLGRGPRCLVLRGRNGWAVSYYTLYTDGSSVPDVGRYYPHYATANGLPDLPDLDITYIERIPRLAYDAHPNIPRLGSVVTYVGRIRNGGREPSPPFRYAWTIDGETVSTGLQVAPIGPGGTLALSLPLHWDGLRHNLTLLLSPGGPEVSNTNDALTVQTDALSLGIWVEQGAYDYFQQYQWEYCAALPCVGSNSFEDWLQRQVSSWNRLLATSIYPGAAPSGVGDRVRLDQVTIVPDGSLPLHGGGPTYSPDLADHTVDLEWGISAAGVAASYHHLWDGPFDLDWSIIHELSHARYLADMYRFDVGVGPGFTFDMKDMFGRPLVNPIDPSSAGFALEAFTGARGQPMLYQNEENDLMACPCTPRYSLYDVLLLNRIRGRRASCGNTDPPCNLGDWYRDIPPTTILRVTDASGAPLPAGTRVILHNDIDDTYTGHAFDAVHVESLTVSGGEVTFPADPFRPGSDPWQRGHALLLIEVRTPTEDHFCFQEPSTFNLAYWQGYSDTSRPAVFLLNLGGIARNDCNLTVPPPLINEPFGTDPATSSLSIVAVRRGKDRVRVRLRDDTDPATPMSGRTVILRAAGGRALAHGVTNVRGEATFTVQAIGGGAWVQDVTDNGTVIPLRPAHPIPLEVPQP